MEICYLVIYFIRQPGIDQRTLKDKKDTSPDKQQTDLYIASLIWREITFGTSKYYLVARVIIIYR